MDKKFDVVIVGTGAAGLYAALNFPESVNILLVSKRELQLSNSSLVDLILSPTGNLLPRTTLKTTNIRTRIHANRILFRPSFFTIGFCFNFSKFFTLLTLFRISLCFLYLTLPVG